MKNKKITSLVWSIPKQIILILCAIVMVTPFIWMILTSFKTLAEASHVPIIWWPSEFRWDNYIEVLDKLEFGRYFTNSVINTVVLTVGQAAICAIAAYAFARLRFPGRNIIFFVILSIMMIPTQMTILPLYLMVSKLGWLNTYAGLVVPNLFSAYGTFFMRQFFMTLPRELEDAAKIDGCSYFKTFYRIMLPLCTNGLIAFGVFTVLWAWNDLLWPLLVLSKDSMRVLPVAIATLSGQYFTHYNLLMAASVLAIIPMVLMYVVGQKYFISGIASSGIKG